MQIENCVDRSVYPLHQEPWKERRREGPNQDQAEMFPTLPVRTACCARNGPSCRLGALPGPRNATALGWRPLQGEDSRSRRLADRRAARTSSSTSSTTRGPFTATDRDFLPLSNSTGTRRQRGRVLRLSGARYGTDNGTYSVSQAG
jgi:hypothetical protein